MMNQTKNQQVQKVLSPQGKGFRIGVFLLFFLPLWGTGGFAQTTNKHPNMVFVEGGTFQMGSDYGEGNDDETPKHEVTINSFFIGKYEVTNEEYAKFLNEYGSTRVKAGSYAGQEMIDINDEYCSVEKVGSSWRAKSGYEKHPVVNVTWYGADAYCRHYGGRLPTEAEWEYAARGGKKSQGYQYAGGDDINQVARYHDNSSRAANRIATRKPNELGIYDMSGNVWEWCSDWYDASYYLESPGNNPKGASSGTFKVLRGGCWNGGAKYCRVADRTGNGPSSRDNCNGFRVVLLP